MVGDEGGEGGVVLQETLTIVIRINLIVLNCHKFKIHLDFVARFVSDNNIVGNTLGVETLRHPEQQLFLTKKF